MEYGALLSESIEYTREALVGKWTTWLVLVLCGLPFSLLVFVFDPEKIVEGNTFHGELIPWTPLILLILAGFLLYFVTSGYLVRVFRGTTTPPVFDNWVSLYTEGIKMNIVCVLWFVPVVLVFAALLTLLALIVFATGIDSVALRVGGLLVTLLATALVLVVALLYSTLAEVRYARTGSIREGLRFTALSGVIREIGWGRYIISLIVLMVVLFFLFLVVSTFRVVPYVGWILPMLLNPFIFVFYARYLSRVYDHGIPQGPTGDTVGEGRQQVDAAS